MKKIKYNCKISFRATSEDRDVFKKKCKEMKVDQATMLRNYVDYINNS